MDDFSGFAWSKEAQSGFCGAGMPIVVMPFLVGVGCVFVSNVLGVVLLVVAALAGFSGSSW